MRCDVYKDDIYLEEVLRGMFLTLFSMNKAGGEGAVTRVIRLH